MTRWIFRKSATSLQRRTPHHIEAAQQEQATERPREARGGESNKDNGPGESKSGERFKTGHRCRQAESAAGEVWCQAKASQCAGDDRFESRGQAGSKDSS